LHWKEEYAVKEILCKTQVPTQFESEFRVSSFSLPHFTFLALAG
jgi:hypothetical protein